MPTSLVFPHLVDEKQRVVRQTANPEASISIPSREAEVGKVKGEDLAL